MREIIKITSAEIICREYLKEISRTLGEARGEASRAWYSRGWFYLKIATRYPDGSVGCHRSAEPLRKKDVLARIELLRQRLNYKEGLNGSN